MGGEIGVRSDGVNGSTFYFTLPYIPAKQERVQPQRVPSLISFSNGEDPVKILLAEDNVVNQKVIARMLQKFKLSVDIASNGEEAVALAKSNVYPIILMDLGMPVMDGKTATKLIREIPHNKEIPILAFSAHVLSHEEQSLFKSDPGFTGFLTKPVTMPTLKATLKLYFPESY